MITFFFDAGGSVILVAEFGFIVQRYFCGSDTLNVPNEAYLVRTFNYSVIDSKFELENISLENILK